MPGDFTDGVFSDDPVELNTSAISGTSLSLCGPKAILLSLVARRVLVVLVFASCGIPLRLPVPKKCLANC